MAHRGKGVIGHNLTCRGCRFSTKKEGITCCGKKNVKRDIDDKCLSRKEEGLFYR